MCGTGARRAVIDLPVAVGGTCNTCTSEKTLSTGRSIYIYRYVDLQSVGIPTGTFLV